ncbi:MAG: hypothetical protein ACFFHD_08425 [Promethearchaeota archaeon]
MDILNLIKIIAAIITVIISFILGFRVLRLNPGNLLNKWFTLFFISSSLGFLAYAVYHSIFFNRYLIIPIMITAQILFNFIVVSLLMTVFILEKLKKIAMSPKYLGTIIGLFIIMSFGYFIWIPTLDIESYEEGIIDTKTDFGWFVFVNIIRIGLCIYIVYKYAMMTREIGEETKRKVQWFFIGVIIVIIGLFFNLAGGIFDSILIEIVALIIIDLGYFGIFKGFLTK